jgi:hypothetical protein
LNGSFPAGTIYQPIDIRENEEEDRRTVAFARRGPLRRWRSLCRRSIWQPPRYRALVTDTYISRWRYTASRYLFSGVQRRDGTAVEGEEWLREARTLYATAAEMYEMLPDVSAPPRQFETEVLPQP